MFISSCFLYAFPKLQLNEILNHKYSIADFELSIKFINIDLLLGNTFTSKTI